MQVDSETLELLQETGFVVDDGFDELADIRRTYVRARSDSPVVITVTTTLDCNLGCYYCYESRSDDKLSFVDIPALLEQVQKRIERSGRSRLHIDWYGGEPTLNLEFLCAASLALQELCSALGIGYSASVVSNGTNWPKDLAGFVKDHRIRQVQISVDGLRRNHNKRRRFRFPSDEQRSSFDEAVALISNLLNYCRVDVRFNIDNGNKGDLFPFIDMANGLGWFSKRFKATFQPARLSNYSERSKFVTRVEVSSEEFQRIQKETALRLPGFVEEAEVPDGYAAPKRSVCAALSLNSIVIGADRRLYRCGLQVSERERAVGTLHNEPFRILGDNALDDRWWVDFDPTTLSSCSKCSFLPVCLGGCPKRHLEHDQKALDAQSIYWRENLARLICKAAGVKETGIRFTEADQFREF
jgi:uncharacterized protein